MRYRVQKTIQPRMGMILQPGDEVEGNLLGSKIEAFKRTGAVIQLPPKKQQVKTETTQAKDEKPKPKRRKKKEGEK